MGNSKTYFTERFHHYLLWVCYAVERAESQLVAGVRGKLLFLASLSKGLVFDLP